MQKFKNNNNNSLILQKYIEQPFLYCNRKFDIRCFLLVTNTNTFIKAYWYQEGYIRTSSKEFDVNCLDNELIHLTNDAIQKNGDNYGKFENGNKLTFQEFQKYLDQTLPEKINFEELVAPQMKEIALDAIKSVFWKIDKRKKQFQFELFGLDFMIDSEFKVQLIEMNTNPCLETSSPILVKLIPQMLDNAFNIAVDPIFPPPSQPWPNTRKYLIPDNLFVKNKFELIFDEKFLPQDLENYKLKDNYLNENQNIINEIDADQQEEEESEEENTDEQDENN